jgi:hypothetical protein
MNHLSPFTLAVLLIRVIALLLMVLSAGGFLYSVTSVVYNIFVEGIDILLGRSLFRESAYPACMFIISVGIYLFSIRIARLLTRGLHPPGHCQRCGYNLASTHQSRCPECGHDEPSHQPPEIPT